MMQPVIQVSILSHASDVDISFRRVISSFESLAHTKQSLFLKAVDLVSEASLGKQGSHHYLYFAWL